MKRAAESAHEGAAEDGETSEEVKNGEDLFGRKEPVGNHPEKERRHYRGDGAHRVGPVDDPGQTDRRHVVPDGDVPGAPDEELEEHHQAQVGN